MGQREESRYNTVSMKTSGNPVGRSELSWSMGTRGLTGRWLLWDRAGSLGKAAFLRETSFQRRLVAESCQQTTFPAAGGKSSPVLKGKSGSIWPSAPWGSHLPLGEGEPLPDLETAPRKCLSFWTWCLFMLDFHDFFSQMRGLYQGWKWQPVHSTGPINLVCFGLQCFKILKLHCQYS